MMAQSKNVAIHKDFVEFKLLKNVHLDINAPSSQGETYLVRGDYFYYHYGCDDTLDSGWGCGYRTLQTICSWISNKQSKINFHVPNILEIQKMLADIECKPSKFVGSHEWIGTMEVFYVLDKLFDAKCRIIHKPAGGQFNETEIEKFINYFKKFGGICMMGGNTDASSKGIAGIHIDKKLNVFLLIIDPHYHRRPKSAAELIEAGYVSWQPLENFSESSFYNVCMPEIEKYHQSKETEEEAIKFSQQMQQNKNAFGKEILKLVKRHHYVTSSSFDKQTRLIQIIR